MSNVILKSIIEMTGQRDADSLECSLVATLAEMVPIHEACLYRRLPQSDAKMVEETICLSVSKNDVGETQYFWHDPGTLVPIDSNLEKALSVKKPVLYQVSSGIRLLIPMSCEGEIIGVLSLESTQGLSEYKTLIEGVVKIYENYSIILNESERDKLTGLLNRRTFDNKLSRLLKIQRVTKEEDVSSERKKGKPQRRYLGPDSFAWLVILDVDHFKRVNDTFGHVYGDEVLLTLSQKMTSTFRSSDLLFRFGGEEFVIVLEPIPFEMAQKTVDRFRKLIAEHLFSQIDQITISLGFSKITENDYPQTVLENADKALYYAKEHGRNCAHNYELLIEKGELVEEKEAGSIDLF
ncbi:MAG: GGDEF domain-containing protein [Nitrospirae bacterium]|nr:GGDEF domain-containing protein [Candidatus Manganitrophaceae bacterium]